jgi:MFS family permease
MNLSKARKATSAANTIGTTAAAHPPRIMLPLILAGQAMAAMDTSIANVAGPMLHAELGISGPLLQCVVAGYILAYAVFLVTGARLGNDHGYRKIFVLGVALFTLSSFLCGIAPNTAVLIAARLAQGLGASLMVPQVLSLIQNNFQGTSRAKAIGYYSMILGLGSAIGQLLGGLIVTANLFGLSWRPAFLINVPIGIAILCFAKSAIPEVKSTVKRKLDLAGVVLLSTSTLLLIVPLTFGQDTHWAPWTWLSAIAGLFGTIVFVRYEKALPGAGGYPLLDLSAIFVPGIVPGFLIVCLGFIGYGGWLFTIALYLQGGLGRSAMLSGMMFAAYALGFGVSNMKWALLPPAILRWAPVCALGLLAAANLAFGLLVTAYTWVPVPMALALFCAGSGHGLSFGTTVNHMTSRIPPEQAPALSGLVTTTVQLSIVVGIAALGAVYFAVRQGLDAVHAMATVNYSCMALALFGTSCAVALLRHSRPAALPRAV